MEQMVTKMEQGKKIVTELLEIRSGQTQSRTSSHGVEVVCQIIPITMQLTGVTNMTLLP